jgi:hypothetical protein
MRGLRGLFQVCFDVGSDREGMWVQSQGDSGL